MNAPSLGEPRFTSTYRHTIGDAIIESLNYHLAARSIAVLVREPTNPS